MALRKLALMHRFFGVLDGHTCRECSNFIKGKYHDKVLGKCKVYGLTHSKATDWAGRWMACGAFNRAISRKPLVREVIPERKRKEAAKSGEWEITTIEQEGSDPEKILRRMFAKYAYGNVPEWFASAVSATSYVLFVDKGKGIECISVLHTATERAPAEIRMTAQTKLLMICQETGMLGGIGSFPVL